ncbi:MAG: hypothetical protein ACR2MA_05495 [Egibacteraceae bacterium]
MDQARQPDGHRQFEDMAVTHVLGGLAESRSRVFRAHLLDCFECRARVGELRAIASNLADVERVERRQRAAKQLETKPRDDDEDDDSDVYVEGTSRRLRLFFALGLVAMGLLASWNFLVRGQVARLEEALDQQEKAGVVRELGATWTSEQRAEGVVGTVKSYEGDIVATLDGLGEVENEVFGIYLLTAEDETLDRRPLVRVNDGRLSVLLEASPKVSRLLVTRSQEITSDPSGLTVYDAVAPPQEPAG